MSDKMRSICWTIILYSMVAGCSSATAPATDPLTSRLDRIAIDYIHQHYPIWGDERDSKRVIIDHGEYWEWTFQLPDGFVGGVPVVLIGKKDEHVIRAYHTQ